MGKNSKADRENRVRELWGTTHRDKLAEALGFDDSLYKGTGARGGLDRDEREEIKKEAQEAFINNNYQVQSAIDWGRNFGGKDGKGNKRAEKLSKELKTPEDFEKAWKYMKAGHKHAGNGGNFSSMGDMIASQDYRFDKGVNAMRSDDGGDGDGNNNNNNNDNDETPLGKSDEHVAAEEEYLSNFTDGNPWAAADPVEAYKRSFNDAKAIGQEWDSGYYMRRLSQDKLEGVNRFTDYLGDMNKLVAHEQNYAALKAINRIDEMGAEPPSFTDPFDLFERYRDELKEDFD